ncbi:MAG TPA: hypothetical protein VHO92_05685, partial [Methanobacterium sp.]|nr:hypothetical protein [Methanobacterium sp.]
MGLTQNDTQNTTQVSTNQDIQVPSTKNVNIRDPEARTPSTAHIPPFIISIKILHYYFKIKPN